MPFRMGRVTFRSPLTTQPPIQESKVIAAFRQTVEEQRQNIVLLERKIADLGNQNEELRKWHHVTPQEEEAYKNQTKLIMDLQGQLDQLALWLRENKRLEIIQGKHRGMSLIDCILKYLGGTMPAPGTQSTDMAPGSGPLPGVQ